MSIQSAVHMQVIDNLRKRYPTMSSGDLQTAVVAMQEYDRLLASPPTPKAPPSHDPNILTVQQPDRENPDGTLFFIHGYSGGFAAEYGLTLTPAAYEAMLVKQGGPGKLFKTEDGTYLFRKAPDVDHDGVHITHCCVEHGCKYGEDDSCPVVNKRAKQKHPCEMCIERGADVAEN